MTTKKFVAIIGTGYTFALAGISFALSLADFFGWFPWTNDKIPSVTLLLLALVLVPLAVSQYILQQDQQALKQDIQNVLKPTMMENTRHLIERVHPNLKIVCNDYLTGLVDDFNMAVLHDKVRIDRQDVVHYYSQTLRMYGHATFFATSIISEHHLWKNSEIESAIKNFTRTGGKMIRIFFVKAGEEEEGKEILENQIKMGVTVYTMNSATVPKHLKSKLFLVDSERRIAWDETFSDEMKELEATYVTVNQDETEKFLDIFRTLEQGARPYQNEIGEHLS